jgi:AraC-like DNA-binding protein
MKTIVRKSAIPETKAFVIKDLVAPYFDPIWHFHPEYQLFLVLEGRGTQFVGDNIKPFKEGDLVFTGPDLPHLWRNNEAYFDRKNGLSTRGIVIYFQENFLEDSVQQKEEMEKIRHLFALSRRGLEVKGKARRQVSELMVELVGLKGVESIIQLLKILDILAHSPDLHPIAHAGYVNLNKESETDRMNKVYEYVMQNFRQKISLEEVAALTNMSLSSFSRYFKTRVNKSFSDFLTEIRIDYACKLLHEERINISQVGYESGFNTLSNFNKQFKEVTGQTPLLYRKEYLKAAVALEGVAV